MDTDGDTATRRRAPSPAPNRRPRRVPQRAPRCSDCRRRSRLGRAGSRRRSRQLERRRPATARSLKRPELGRERPSKPWPKIIIAAERRRAMKSGAELDKFVVENIAGSYASRERDAYAACDALSRSFRGWPTARIREVEQCYVDLLRAVPRVDGRDVPSLECLPSGARFSAPVSAAAGTVASIALRRRECGPADSDSGRDGGSKMAGKRPQPYGERLPRGGIALEAGHGKRAATRTRRGRLSRA